MKKSRDNADYKENDVITGYKSGGINSDYIIELNVSTDPTNTNLSRKDVVDDLTAQYRCKKAFVVSIKHKKTGELKDFIESNYNSEFIYTVGQWVEEPNYNTNNDICYTQGIHFYKSINPAIFYNWHPINGPYKSWYDNGLLEVEVMFKDGKLDGIFKRWYENGELWEEYMYKDGIRDGAYTKWHWCLNQLVEKGTYKNGKLDGIYKTWYENGELCEEYMYKDGKLDGIYRRWDCRGNLEHECVYKDNVLIT